MPVELVSGPEPYIGIKLSNSSLVNALLEPTLVSSSRPGISSLHPSSSVNLKSKWLILKKDK